VRTLTVDDHAPFLEVAHELIEATPGFELVGEATTGHGALASVAESEPELMLVDVRMPDMDGVEVARRVRESHPGVVVILISAEDPAELPTSARGCGAAALVRKEELGPSMLRSLWERHGHTS
jgi:DNA-binding NarL/FixJ family response regulator